MDLIFLICIVFSIGWLIATYFTMYYNYKGRTMKSLICNILMLWLALAIQTTVLISMLLDTRAEIQENNDNQTQVEQSAE